MQLRPRRRPVLLLAVVGLAAGLLLAAALSSPRIIAILPDDSATDVPGKAPLRISFNQPMDHASVELHLAIEPRPGGDLRWEGNSLVFQPIEPWPSGERVEARLGAGALSARRLPLLSETAWAFEVGVPRIVYLWPAEGPAELYARTLEADEPLQLTDTSGVLDYSLTADGSAVAYAAYAVTGQVEIRLRELPSGDDRLLHACLEGMVCRAPALSPDAGWLAFEVHDGNPDGRAPGAVLVRVHLVRVNGGEPAFPLAAADHATSQPVWSPLGWLAYYDHTLQAYAFVVEPAGPDQPVDLYIPNALGDRGDWSPDGETFVLPELVFVAETPTVESEDQPPVFYSHLYRVDVRSGAVLDLSGEEGYLVEDAGPAFSPDGLWLVFSRKYLDRSRWTLGRQIWRMRTDGLGAEALTDQPSLNHSALAWSPDGESLVYMLFDQTDMTRPAEVWWTAVDGSQGGQLALGAYSPQWSP
jgi:hypothetical protein